MHIEGKYNLKLTHVVYKMIKLVYKIGTNEEGL